MSGRSLSHPENRASFADFIFQALLCIPPLYNFADHGIAVTFKRYFIGPCKMLSLVRFCCHAFLLFFSPPRTHDHTGQRHRLRPCTAPVTPALSSPMVAHNLCRYDTKKTRKNPFLPPVPLSGGVLVVLLSDLLAVNSRGLAAVLPMTGLVLQAWPLVKQVTGPGT